jgi:pimeloyl-ACP methyl ester carboxylesterase
LTRNVHHSLRHLSVEVIVASRRPTANDTEALRAAVAVDRPDVSSSFQGFPQPCLFFAGTDAPLRSRIERTAELLPHARMVEIRGCNHMTALQRADFVLPPVLRFLTKADGSKIAEGRAQERPP